MSSLDSAIPLIHVHIVSMLVSENLNFDMPWMLDILFDNHVIIIETLHGFSLRCIKLIHELSLISYDPHAFSTTTERCLEHDREADFARLLEQELWAIFLTMIPLENGHTSFLHNTLALTLGAHLADGTGRGSNECKTLRLNQLNKVSILREETISVR